MPNIDWKHLFTGFDGRIGRQTYWIGIIAVGIVSVILQSIVSSILGPTAAFIVSLPFLYPAYAIMLKRGHDRGRPDIVIQAVMGAFVLANVLALTGVYLLVMIGGLISLAAVVYVIFDLGILKGSEGPNEYGPDPLATA